MNIKVRKIFKKVFCSLILISVLLSLCACSPVTLTTKETLLDNGEGNQVSCTLSINLEGIDAQHQNRIYALACAYTSQLDSEYEKNLISLFSPKYGGSEHIILGKVLLNNPKFVKGDTDILRTDNNEILVNVDFASIFAYLVFFCPKALMYDEDAGDVTVNHEVYNSLVDIPSPSVSLEKEEDLFMYKYIETLKPFSYNLEEPRLFTKYHSKYTGTKYLAKEPLTHVVCSELGLPLQNEEDAKYVYNFITPYSRLHSSADSIDTQFGTGDYVHSWTLSSIGDLVKMWRMEANESAWYVLCICISILLIIFGMVCLHIVRRVKRHRNTRALEELDALITMTNKGGGEKESQESSGDSKVK